MERNVMVKYRELKVGDVVKLSNNHYMAATITKIEDGLISLFRPYVHHDYIETSGGLTCYTGVETFSIFQDSERMMYCYEHDVGIK